MSKRIDLVYIGLAVSLILLFVGYGILSYPLPLIIEIGLGTLGLAGLTTVVHSLYARGRGRHGEACIAVPASDSLLTILLLVLSSVITIQALIARESYGTTSPLDAAWGYPLIARLVHGLFIIAAVWAGRAGALEVGLAGAVVYSSAFFTPTFAVPEAGWPFGPQAALALALVARTRSMRPHANAAFLPLALFLLWCVVASALSLCPAQSLAFLQKLVTLVLFAWVLAMTGTRRSWERTLWLVALTSVGLPTLLAVAKLVELAWKLGLWPAVHYRLAIAELGGANLIAQMLVTGFPVVVALALTSARKAGWWTLAVLALVAFGACRSWGATVSAVLTALAVLAFQRRDKLARFLQHRRWAVGVLVLCVALSLPALLRLASESNIVSFNGRLFHFRVALGKIAAHPFFGVGPGHQYTNARYSADVDWVVEDESTQDNPLSITALLPVFSQMHSHNLFLEVAAGAGLPAVVLLTWFLIRLLREGFATLSQARGRQHCLLLGCLAGVLASLGWGLLDVMVVSAPFFAFPTWALVGLLWAAPRALAVGEPERGRAEANPNALHPWGPRRSAPGHAPPAIRQLPAVLLWLGIAITGVASPLLGNLQYRSGYLAFQDRLWSTASDRFGLAARLEPLNAKYQEMRAAALINQGQYLEAAAAYERAVRLQRDFAPYHLQLGWLYWLQGDLGLSTAHLQMAVSMDPGGALREDTGAALALAKVAQADVSSAVGLFAGTIERHPQMAQAPDWLRVVQGPGRAFDVVLDPAYSAGGAASGEPGAAGTDEGLQTRLLAHLGRADYTSRLWAPSAAGELSFNQVLDAVEADAWAAGTERGSRALRFRASMIEAARIAGLEERAAQAYLAFQRDYPQSAYGFRDLGRLYREQGRLVEAQDMLQEAVEVSPRDVDSWLELAEVYVNAGLDRQAEGALKVVYRLAPLEPRWYRLRALLYEAEGDLAQAADVLQRATLFQASVDESIDRHLAVADLLRRLDQPQRASDECERAVGVLAASPWTAEGRQTRPLDAALLQVADCLSHDPRPEVPGAMVRLVRASPLIGNIVAGHVYRARSELDEAQAAYRRAAEARPDTGAPHYFLAETWRAAGQPEAAEPEYRLAAQLDPWESLPLLALGGMHWDQGQTEAAAANYAQAVAMTPGWGRAHTALGNALRVLGDHSTAAEEYRQALAADGDLDEGLLYDLAANLAEAEIEAPGANYVRNDYFGIDGTERRVLFMHPPAQASYAVAIPAGARLEVEVATAPESWTQPGDGVAFEVWVESAEGRRQLASTSINPKHNREDRRWHRLQLDLSAYAGQMVQIVLETSSGPAGDERYDWAVWGRPRLVR